MVDLPSLAPGLSATVQHRVDRASTAGNLGSGTVDVLATPELVRWMEMAAVAALADAMPPGVTTVGAAIRVEHLAATPIGLGVEVTATLTEVHGRRLTFEVTARDEVEEIGRASHERVLVDLARFMERTNSKLKGASSR
jgi:fluoroacetyl-CoA thioesterase